MKTIAKPLLLISMAVWTFVCWHWYTCSIKGFCGEKTEAHEKITLKTTPETKIVSLPAPPSKEIIKKISPPEKKNSKKEMTMPEEKERTPLVVIPKKCEAHITQHIALGRKNSTTSVKKLENFLNNYEGFSLSVDGVYSATDDKAIRAFQKKYSADILAPWNLSQPTGNVFTTTVKKINELYCQKK